MSKQQDRERKTFAEALEIKKSISLSESDDPGHVLDLPATGQTEDLPDVVEDDDSGLEMKGLAVENNLPGRVDDST